MAGDDDLDLAEFERRLFPSRSAHGRPTTGTRFSRPPSRDNVVVETRTCEVPSVASSPMDPADPDWAVPDAERLANAMLNKVKV